MSCQETAPSAGIAVDAAHSARERMTEYRGVDLATGAVLFHRALGNQTVNIGEFLAIVEAVKYVMDYDCRPARIYSDSATAITWYRNKRTASGKRYPPLMKAEIYLRAAAYWIDGIEVLKWDNDRWGEIPADFGNKH